MGLPRAWWRHWGEASLRLRPQGARGPVHAGAWARLCRAPAVCGLADPGRVLTCLLCLIFSQTRTRRRLQWSPWIRSLSASVRRGYRRGLSIRGQDAVLPGTLKIDALSGRIHGRGSQAHSRRCQVGAPGGRRAEPPPPPRPQAAWGRARAAPGSALRVASRVPLRASSGPDGAAGWCCVCSGGSCGTRCREPALLRLQGCGPRPLLAESQSAAAPRWVPPRPPSPRRQCHTPPASCPRSPRTPWFTRAAAFDVSVSNSQSRRAQVTRSCGRPSDPGARHVPALPAGPGDGALLSASSDPQWLRHPRVGGGRSSQRDRAGAGAGLAWQTPGLGVRRAALCRWRRPGEGVTSVPRGEGGQWGASAVTPLHGLSQPSRCWPRHATPMGARPSTGCFAELSGDGAGAAQHGARPCRVSPFGPRVKRAAPRWGSGGSRPLTPPRWGGRGCGSPGAFTFPPLHGSPPLTSTRAGDAPGLGAGRRRGFWAEGKHGHLPVS